MDSRTSSQQQVARIGETILNQDNRCTSYPMYLVEQKVRQSGIDLDYCDKYFWINTDEDHREATQSEVELCESLRLANGDLGAWIQVGYVERMEFVTACFTQIGCEEFIKQNQHNLREPRIYVASGYRNSEYIAIRQFLINQAQAKQ